MFSLKFFETAKQYTERKCLEKEKQFATARAYQTLMKAGRAMSKIDRATKNNNNLAYGEK